jgi:ubiquinone/menaquinone biosynthesis C-methylase UbiE
MDSDLKKWIDKKGEEVLRKVGIKCGQKILDFGCGSGNYTIPSAKIVKREGKVYALDKNKSELDKLTKKAMLKGLKNIVRMETSGELRINLEDEFVDVIMLYDVLHHWYFPRAEDRRTILLEFHRVLKHDGFLSFYPGDPEVFSNYSELKALIMEIRSANFYLERKNSFEVIHENRIQNGHIQNFRKNN